LAEPIKVDRYLDLIEIKRNQLKTILIEILTKNFGLVGIKSGTTNQKEWGYSAESKAYLRVIFYIFNLNFKADANQETMLEQLISIKNKDKNLAEFIDSIEVSRKNKYENELFMDELERQQAN